MKPRAIFKSIPNQGGIWFLLNWQSADGQMLLAPSLAMLVDGARKEEATKQ